jgi:hypothetical protein
LPFELAVNPYMAFETINGMKEKGIFASRLFLQNFKQIILKPLMV